METTTDQPNLRCLLADQIPEASREFMALPSEASISTIFFTFYWVTAEFAHQYKFRSVKRCLLVAEELFLAGDNPVSHAVCSIYLAQLTKLIDKRKRNAQSELIEYLLPRSLRAEYRCRLTTTLTNHQK